MVDLASVLHELCSTTSLSCCTGTAKQTQLEIRSVKIKLDEISELMRVRLRTGNKGRGN